MSKIEINLEAFQLFQTKIYQEICERFDIKNINKLIDVPKQNDTDFSFVKHQNLIYKNDNHKMLFILQRLCISTSFVQNIL